MKMKQTVRNRPEYIRNMTGLLLFLSFFLISYVSPARAGISGSKHDFSGISSMSPTGSCSSCHRAHFAQESLGLWSRDLTQERNFFENTSNLPTGSKYTWGYTLICYDCHDNHNNVDDDPDDINFSTNPHDAAFDYNMKTTDYGTWNGIGGTTPEKNAGYFEDIYEDGTLMLHGGHYFKSADPDGIGGSIKLNDKLPCEDCHDPHETQNECFIKTTLGGGSHTGLDASGNTRYGSGNGRDMCAACHGYGNIGGDTSSWSEVNPSYSASGTIIATPGTADPGAGDSVAAHVSTASMACTSCHTHNALNDYSDCYRCHSAANGIAIPVDDGVGDDFSNSTAGGLDNLSIHNIGLFSDADSSSCKDCHVLSDNHADGDTYNDLADPDGDGIDWPIFSGAESEQSFARLIEYCLDCHDGDGKTWFDGGLTAPNVNMFIDTGVNGRGESGEFTRGGDDQVNAYGQADDDLTPITDYLGLDPSLSPIFFDTLTGAGHDPPLGYGGVPLFAHYAQTKPNDATGIWWKIDSALSSPQAMPCLDCHFVHGSRNEALYRSPAGTEGLLSEDTSKAPSAARAICLDCHNGASVLEGMTVPDPTNPRLDDRAGDPVDAHDPLSGIGCSPYAGGSCHNPHAPSCEICHSYPPDD